MPTTLDRFDEVIGGATNDEVIELAYRMFEELADRAGTVAEMALGRNEQDRDLVNEAHVYATTVKGLFPFSPKEERVREADYYVLDVADRVAKAVAARGAEGSTTKSVWIRRSPAARRAAAKERAEKERKGCRTARSGRRLTGCGFGGTARGRR